MAMGLLGALLTLVGCNEKGSYDEWAGDRKTLNPPPKPPNCSNLPELTNVTREDGTIVDVRIIQIDDVLFYVPRNWLDRNLEFSYAFASTYHNADSQLGVYDPDLHNVECPGVVHKFVSKRNIFDLYFRFVLRRGNSEPWIMPNFTLETKAVSLSIHRPRGFDDPMYETPNINTEGIVEEFPNLAYSARIMLVPNHLVGLYPWPKDKPVGSPDWKRTRADVIDLVKWLRTPPKMRDNERIFKLGADK
jgi:hypothetical protein